MRKLFTNRTHTAVAAGVLLTWLQGTSPAAAQIVNGDFSSGNTGFTSGYLFAASNTVEQEYTVGTSPSLFNAGAPAYGDHTTGAGLMLIANGAVTPDVPAWAQTVTVTPGAAYRFSAWVSSWGVGEGVTLSPALLDFRVGGVSVGPVRIAPATKGVWQQVDWEWNSGGAATAELSLVDLNTAASENDFALDDLALTPRAVTAPEPGTVALVAPGIACVTAVAIRKRRNRAAKA